MTGGSVSPERPVFVLPDLAACIRRFSAAAAASASAVPVDVPMSGVDASGMFCAFFGMNRLSGSFACKKMSAETAALQFESAHFTALGLCLGR